MVPPALSGRRGRRAFLRGIGQAAAAGLVLALRGPHPARAEPPTVRRVLSGRVAHDDPARFAWESAQGLTLLHHHAHHPTGGSGAASVHRSPVLPLAFPATHLGARWTAAGRGNTALRVSVRTSMDGYAWSAWLLLPEQGRQASADGQEMHSSLARVPEGRFVQYRVERPADSDARLLRLTLSYLNPFSGPEQLASAPPAHPAQFPFPFRTREEWGADEALRFDAAGGEIWPPVFVPVKKLVVHHTATTNDYTDAAAEVRAIYVYHAQELGWGDIGYNALIGRDGVVYEGRRGRGPARASLGREVLSPGVVAGHAYFHNYGTAGYALIGTFVDTPLPALMRERLVQLLAYEARRHGTDPTTLSDFLRSDAIWHRDVPNLAGHRDLVVTECPGDAVYRLLPDLRAAVVERLGGAGAATAGRVRFWSVPPQADTTARTGAAAWAGVGAGGGWTYSYYLEYWRREGADTITPADNRPGWRRYTPVTGTGLTELVPGHYTLHVRGRDPLGREAVFETTTSFRVSDELLADDEDLGQTERHGPWQRRTDGSGLLGESWAAAPAGAGEAVFRWRPLVTEAGWYEVWVRWPVVAGLAADAPYRVIHADGVYDERRDQQGQGGEWVRLGDERLFRFRPGRAGGVVLTNAATGPVAADAVKLVLRRRAAERS